MRPADPQAERLTYTKTTLDFSFTHDVSSSPSVARECQLVLYSEDQTKSDVLTVHQLPLINVFNQIKEFPKDWIPVFE
jgi:hypothetical protein